MTRPRTAPRMLRSSLLAAVVAVIVAGLLPGPGPAVARTEAQPAQHVAPVEPPDPAAVLPVDGVEAAGIADSDSRPDAGPSTAYEEAMAHEHDKIEFEPGERVTVGFSPRRDDDWSVGGKAPSALPAGRASGRQMDESPNGSTWTAIGAAPSSPGTGSEPGPGRAADNVTGPAGGTEPTPAPIDAPGGDSIIVATPVSATMPQSDPVFDLAAASGLRRQVYGFLPYWELRSAASKLDYNVLSTVAYFSVGASSNGSLKKRDPDGTSTTGWGGWASSNMTSVINSAHRKGTRVVLTVSVFAWTSSQARVQRALLGSSAARMNLVRQTVAAVRDRGADGVNLDFEPLARGYEDEFVSLVRAFRSEFNKVKSGYQVVYDATGYAGNYPLERSVGTASADAVFIMGYDYRTSGSSTAGSIDALAGPGYDLRDTVRAYTARVSPSRVILGIPWYGRAWSTTSSATRAKNQSGLKYGYSTAVNYETVASYVAKYGRRWDSVEQSPYVAYRRKNCTSSYGCVTSWRQIYYDDAASMKLRYAVVNDYKLRGAGIWALGYEGGHSELYRALSDSFLVDKAAPVAGIKALAVTQRDEGFVVWWVAKDVSSIASYDIQVSVDGGGWHTWLSKTRRTSEVYPGRDGKAYAFRVRATDSKGHTGSWNVSSTYKKTPTLAVGGFGRVVRDGLSYRAGPDTSARRLGSLPTGTIVAITRGPVSADGYKWYEVTQPIREWSPVAFAERGVWIATSTSSTTLVKPWRAPNATIIDAGIRGFDFGSPKASSVGTASAQVAVRTFSPNGDGSEDSVRLRWTNTVAMRNLVLKVYRTNGSLVGSVSVPKRASGAQAWYWNGKIKGTRVKDGTYVLQLVGTSGGRTYRAPSARPATRSQIARYGVVVDTVPPRATASSISTRLLSPDGDGYRETTKVALTASGAVRWAARVTNSAGTVLRTASGSGKAASWTWNGKTNGGTRVADGRYSVSIYGYDAAGNFARRTWTVTVDLSAPAVKPAASSTAFSPNGDGTADTTVLSWTANEPSSGTARLYKGKVLIRSWTFTGKTSWRVTWDGRRADGSRAIDGTYAFRVYARDTAGNRRTVSTSVRVDRTGGSLAWSRSFFPQDADAVKPTSTVRWSLTRNATTTLRLYDASGRWVRTVWKSKAQSKGTHSWTWDGKKSDGTYAAQGAYAARLTVVGPYATLTLVRSVQASAFAITPSATTVRAGKTLTVTFRTIEALSTRPRVTFTQPGRKAVTVTSTKVSNGVYRAAFRVQSGRAGTGLIRVTAVDTSGGPNASSLTVRVAS